MVGVCRLATKLAKMQCKTLFLLTMATLMVMSNYVTVSMYFDEYYPEYFNMEKLMDIRYRCYRYFNDKVNNGYMCTKCKPYIYDYKNFILEKNRYIFAFYAHNIVMGSLFSIFYLLL
jgi:hypothetical protein